MITEQSELENKVRAAVQPVDAFFRQHFNVPESDVLTYNSDVQVTHEKLDYLFSWIDDSNDFSKGLVKLLTEYVGLEEWKRNRRVKEIVVVFAHIIPVTPYRAQVRLDVRFDG